MEGPETFHSYGLRRLGKRFLNYFKKRSSTCFYLTFIMFTNLLLISLSYSTVMKEYKALRRQLNDICLQNRTAAAVEETYETLPQKEKVIELEEQVEGFKKKLEEMDHKNRELTEDNIELQNSLKMAASAGTKPQNYQRFEGLSSRGSLERGKYIGKFLGTAYTPSKDECGNNQGITCSGKPIIPGISVAIDNEYWPFGTVFYIKGLGYAVAMDTGSAIKGKNRFDFAVFNKEFAKELGSRYWDVYLVKMGNGKVEDIAIY